MSKYTTMIRWLVENDYNLGMADYPIFDETYRAVLNKKIITHYYFREIGLETPALFSWFLNMRLNEIMPYYNQLYESAKLAIEPLTRMDYSEDYSKAQKQTGNTDSTLTQTDDYSGTANTDSTGQNINSDTPQNMMLDADISTSNTIPASEATINKSVDMQTSTSKDTKDATNKSTQAIDTTENYIKKIQGNNASRTDSSMLKEWRDTFLNIDMLVINDLEDLFMCVY